MQASRGGTSSSPATCSNKLARLTVYCPGSVGSPRLTCRLVPDESSCPQRRRSPASPSLDHVGMPTIGHTVDGGCDNGGPCTTCACCRGCEFDQRPAPSAREGHPLRERTAWLLRIRGIYRTVRAPSAPP